MAASNKEETQILLLPHQNLTAEKTASNDVDESLEMSNVNGGSSRQCDSPSQSLERKPWQQQQQQHQDPLNLLPFKVDLKQLSGKSKEVKGFYEAQNELIDSFLADPEEEDDRDEIEMIEYKLAMYGSFSVNICLFALQLTAAILSKSLALLATTLDSFMDLASNLVLIYTGRLAASHNYLVYPTGKGKYKTAGVIVFATLMGTLSLQIWSESIQTLIRGSDNVNTGMISITLVASGIGIKVLLFLFCRLYSHLPSIAVLAQDHFNDVFFNSTGLVLSFLATQYYGWIDPVGAILIAGLIIRSWGTTALENIQFIVGITADPAFLNKVTYLSLVHDRRILKVDTARAYHSGYSLYVEVDIVLSPDMPLAEAHDVGESLQMKLESLQQVDRAFVHLDYEVEHKPEHKASQSLRKRRSTKETV